MDNITIFNNPEFGDVRTIMINGEPWFVASDVAKMLGYRMASDMTRRIDDEDKGTRLVRTPSSDQVMTIINESGLYSAILNSKIESAKRFKRWVTGEILPEIRKTGSYGQVKLPKNSLELLTLHYEAIKEVNNRVDTLFERVDEVVRDMPILPVEADKITSAVKRKGVGVMGGIDSAAYRNGSLRAKVYKSIYSNLKYNFGTSSYKSIKRSEVEKAIEIINEYKPPYVLENEINQANSQLRLFVM